MFGVEQKIFIVFEISEVRFIPAFPCCFSTWYQWLSVPSFIHKRRRRGCKEGVDTRYFSFVQKSFQSWKTSFCIEIVIFSKFSFCQSNSFLVLIGWKLRYCKCVFKCEVARNRFFKSTFSVWTYAFGWNFVAPGFCGPLRLPMHTIIGALFLILFYDLRMR